MWPTLTICRNVFVGYPVSLEFQYNLWCGKVCPHIPSTCATYAIMSFLIMHMISSCQICVAIDNPSLVPSVCCLESSTYFWNYVCVAANASHAENLQSNGWRCLSGGYTFWDGSNLPEFSGIEVITWANHNSTTAPSLIRSLTLNSHCSFHGRRPFSSP